MTASVQSPPFYFWSSNSKTSYLLLYSYPHIHLQSPGIFSFTTFLAYPNLPFLAPCWFRVLSWNNWIIASVRAVRAPCLQSPSFKSTRQRNLPQIASWIYSPPAPQTLRALFCQWDSTQILHVTFKILSYPFIPVTHDYLQSKDPTPCRVVCPPLPEPTGSIPVSEPQIMPSSLLGHPSLSSLTRIQSLPPPATSRKVFSPCLEALLYLHVCTEQRLLIRLAAFSQTNPLPVGCGKCVKVRTWISPQLPSFFCVYHKNQVHGKCFIKLS